MDSPVIGPRYRLPHSEEKYCGSPLAEGLVGTRVSNDRLEKEETWNTTSSTLPETRTSSILEGKSFEIVSPVISGVPGYGNETDPSKSNLRSLSDTGLKFH